MTRDDASRQVRRAVEATGATRQAFADKAKVDPGTLSDFLDGRRWPQAPTRRKIEQALGWPPGRITDLTDGGGVRRDGTEHAAAGVEEAIRNDPDLLPEARSHLLNQYQLLRRLRAEVPSAEATDRESLDKQGAAELRLVREMKEAEAEPAPVKKGAKRPKPPLR